MALCAQAGFGVPVLSGDGLEPLPATGTFGTAGSIYEYRVQGTPSLGFTASLSTGIEGLRLSYAFVASAALAAASAAVYLDADINQDANTWFNERGEASVAAGGATTWEIDEPGFGTAYIGNVFDNFANGAFDNSVFGGEAGLVEDVAMGLAFGFGALGAGDRLLMEILISETAIGAGWGTVLHQWDDTDGPGGDNLYFAGRYSIERRIPDPTDPPDPGVVPEPMSMSLMALGLLGLAAWRRRS